MVVVVVSTALVRELASSQDPSHPITTQHLWGFAACKCWVCYEEASVRLCLCDRISALPRRLVGQLSVVQRPLSSASHNGLTNTERHTAHCFETAWENKKGLAQA